jgi:hypothetical protein
MKNIAGAFDLLQHQKLRQCLLAHAYYVKYTKYTKIYNWNDITHCLILYFVI